MNRQPRHRNGQFGRVHREDPGQIQAQPLRVTQEVDIETATALMRRRQKQTEHARRERQKRLGLAEPGAVYRAFVVDREGRPDRLEVHVVTRNAEVWGFSVRTAKLITVIFARPGQVVRYFGKERVDEDVMDAARHNVQSRRNLS